jgi:hypothetical protein
LSVFSQGTDIPMPESTENTSPHAAPGRPSGSQKARGLIELVDGEVAIPRSDFAAMMHSSERTIARKGFPSVAIGGVIYVLRNAALRMILEEARVPPAYEPTARGRKPR